MNKKLIVTSLALMLGVASFAGANAFFGGQGEGHEGKRGEMHQRMEMTQDHFDEMKAMFNKYTNVADFIVAKKAMHEKMKDEHEAMKESVTKNVEKISNGIIVTITSTDSAAVEKIQNKEHRNPKSEEITRTIEKIANGVKMTITSDNAELVEKIQNHGAKMNNKGEEMNHQGMRRGKRMQKNMNKEGRFAKFRQRRAERANR